MEYTTYQGSFFDQKADLASATPIEVGAGETVTGINSTLPEAEEADSDASLYLPSITR